MEDKDVVMIPFVVHEGDMARQERTMSLPARGGWIEIADDQR